MSQLSDSDDGAMSDRRPRDKAAVLVSAAQLSDWDVTPDDTLLDMIKNEDVVHFTTRERVATLSSVHVSGGGHVCVVVHPLWADGDEEERFVMLGIEKNDTEDVVGVQVFIADAVLSLHRGWPLEDIPSE